MGQDRINSTGHIGHSQMQTIFCILCGNLGPSSKVGQATTQKREDGTTHSESRRWITRRRTCLPSLSRQGWLCLSKRRPNRPEHISYRMIHAARTTKSLATRTLSHKQNETALHEHVSHRVAKNIFKHSVCFMQVNKLLTPKVSTTLKIL